MMNNYLHGHKRSALRTSSKAFLSALVFVGMVSAIHLFFPSFFSSIAHDVVRPLWLAEREAARVAPGFMELLHSKQILVLENEKLRQELSRERSDRYTLTMLKEENRELKAFLGRNDTEEEMILAAILARPNASPYDTFVIDVGSIHGIGTGNLVLVSGGIVLGIVERVFAKTALVKLFSTAGVETRVSIGPKQVQVLAKGLGGGTFEAHLPRGVSVEVGDSAVMSDINPKLFGVIEEIESDPALPFSTIFFKNPVNMQEVRWVAVLKK